MRSVLKPGQELVVLVEGFDPTKASSSRRSVCAPPPPSHKSRGSVGEESTSQNNLFVRTTGNRGKFDRAIDGSNDSLGPDLRDDPHSPTCATNTTTARIMSGRSQWAMRKSDVEHREVVGHMKNIPRVEKKSRFPDDPDFRERGDIDATEIGGEAKIDHRWRTIKGGRRAFGFPAPITRQTRAGAGVYTFPDNATDNSEQGGYNDGGFPSGVSSSSSEERAPNGLDGAAAFHDEHGGDDVDDDDGDTLTEYGDDEDADNEGKSSTNGDRDYGRDDPRLSAWSVPSMSISPASTDSGTRTCKDFTEIIDKSDRGADNNTAVDSTATGRIHRRKETSQVQTESVSQGGETKEGYSETRSPPRSVLSAMFSAWGNSGI